MTSLAVAPLRSSLPTPEDVLAIVGRSLDDDQAENVVVIELAGKSTMADYMVIGSGRSSRHVDALGRNLLERLKTAGVACGGLEGVPQCDWVLVDAGDVIIHLFRPEVRLFYNLEKMWEGPPPNLDRLTLAPDSPGAPDAAPDSGA